MDQPTSIPQLPICWVNELDGDPDISTSTIFRIKIAKEKGHVVVNAARPLPGTETWQGRFRRGIYYAAGDPARFGQIWADLDAKELRLVSNARILRLVIEEAHRKGYGNNLDLLRGFTPDKLADQAVSWLNMPFYAKEAVADWQQMLADADWSAPGSEEG